jgi:histidine kinase/DNA gyrase B/HSP90-like ATPase
MKPTRRAKMPTVRTTTTTIPKNNAGSNSNSNTNNTNSNIDIQDIAPSSSINAKIIVVDKQDSLAMEIKGGIKDDLNDTMGLSTYSNSKSTIASYCRKTTTTTTIATTRRPHLIEQGQQEQKQQYEIITIKDTGTEIHSEILPRLFSKFATKSNREGTGLGLYISKNIIEAHGGKGATFTIALPLVKIKE